MTGTRPASPRGVLRDAQPPLVRFVPGLAAGVGTAISAVALLGASAWLLADAAAGPAAVGIAVAIVAVRVFAVLRGGFRYLERVAGHQAALTQLARVRERLVRRISPLAPDGLGRTRRGELLSNLVDDVDELQNLPLRVVMPLAIAGVTAIASVAVTTALAPAAGLALACCLVVAFGVAVGLGWAAGARAERDVAPLRGRLSDALLDEITALDVLAAYDATEAASRRVRQADEALRDATVGRSRAQGLTSGTVAAAAAAASFLALWAALPAGGADGPVLAVVALLPIAVFEVFGPVPLAIAAWRQVRSAAERIADTVPDAPPAGIPLDHAAAGADTDGVSVPLGDGIVVAGLRAAWPSADGESDGALQGVRLRIAPGERILVTGASGSGKTTLAHALVRFIESTGEYTIGGLDARSVPPAAVRRTIGLVEQQAYLFDASLAENLRLGAPDATDAELLGALDRVGLADWTAARGGVDAPLGERGSLVSGGQAQRLALARALLADFAVLILDEPTAGVDPAASDALLTTLLAAVPADRAVLLISHVDVPTGSVDRVVALDRGVTGAA